MRNVYTLCFISFLIIFCSIDITSLYAQGNVKTGEITGKIVDEEDGSELIGATVVVKGTGIGVIANVNGEFQLDNVPLGPQVLEFSFVGYSKTEISVNVQEGVLINLTAKLKQSTLLDEVTVVAKADIQYSPIRNSTDVQLISKMKFSEGVMVGISNEQIAKSADRDASQIVQRISGVSLVDRFVVVRGLDPRYNMTLINGLVGPSSEENSRSFSFDALPSGVIDRIEVEKSPGPHLPGMWGGGVIKIFTRSFTTTRAFNFDISTAYRSNGSSFNNNFLTYNASNKDWLAGGASDRSLPAIMRQPNFVYPDFNRYPLENIAIARSPGLQSYVPKEKNSNVDKRINFSYYDSWNIGGKQLNSLTALSYSQENVFRRTKTSTEAGTFLKADNEGSFNPGNHIDSTSHSNGDTWYRERPEQDGIDSLFEEQIRISAVQSLGVILNDNHRISGTLFYNRFGTDQLSIRQGREKDLTGSVVKTYTYQYEQRDIVVGQLGGMHQLSSNSNIEWTLGTSVTTNYVPDLQRYTFFHELSRGLDTTMWQVAYGNNFTETFNTHYVLETKEASATARVDFRKDFTSGFYMKAGGFYDRKERGFYAYQYGTYNNADGNVNGNYTLEHSYKPWMKMDSLQSSSQYATDNLYLRARASQRAYFF